MPRRRVSPLMRDLSEIVNIERQDPNNRRLANTVASNVDIVIEPQGTRDFELPTGQLVNRAAFKGMLFAKDTRIREADIVVRADGSRLFIHRSLPYGDAQELELNEPTG